MGPSDGCPRSFTRLATCATTDKNHIGGPQKPIRRRGAQCTVVIVDEAVLRSSSLARRHPAIFGGAIFIPRNAISNVAAIARSWHPPVRSLGSRIHPA